MIRFSLKYKVSTETLFWEGLSVGSKKVSIRKWRSQDVVSRQLSKIKITKVFRYCVSSYEKFFRTKILQLKIQDVKCWHTRNYDKLVINLVYLKWIFHQRGESVEDTFIIIIIKKTFYCRFKRYETLVIMFGQVDIKVTFRNLLVPNIWKGRSGYFSSCIILFIEIFMKWLFIFRIRKIFNKLNIY